MQIVSLNPGHVRVTDRESETRAQQTGDQIKQLSRCVYQLYLAKATMCLCVGGDCILCAFLTIVDMWITQKQQT